MKITLENNTVVSFSKIELSGSQKVAWGISDCGQYHLKVAFALGKKINTLKEEADILRHLNTKNCQSCAKLFLYAESDGDDIRAIYHKAANSPVELPLKTTFPIMVTNALDLYSPILAPDLLLAIIEQKHLGIWNGDLSTDDIRKDPITGALKLTDYDQAIRLNKATINMPNIEFMRWLNTHAEDVYGYYGQDTFYYNIGVDWDYFIQPNFIDNSLNLDRVSLFKGIGECGNNLKIQFPLSTEDFISHGLQTQNERIRLLNKINFQPHEKVLEIGCNVGALGYLMESKGCDVHGIDIDPRIIIGARILKNIIGNSNNQFICHDLDSGNAIGDYDTICLFSVLHQIQNIEESAARIARSCKRIIMDCRLRERGTKLVDGQQVDASQWSFDALEDLITYLETLFTGFALAHNHGETERNRHFLEFIKK